MSSANNQGNASTRTYPADHSTKAMSEGPTTMPQKTSPRTALSLTVPTVANVSRQNGELSEPVFHPGVSGALPTRHGDVSMAGGHISASNFANMSSVGGYGSLSLAPHRRKRSDGGTTMTLFVREKDSAVSDGNTLATNSGGKGNANALHKDKDRDEAKTKGGNERNPSKMLLALVDNAISAVTAAPGKATDELPAFAKTLAKPAMTAACVFLFFLLVEIYTLMQASHSVQALLDSTTDVNDQLLTVSASLTEQYMMKKEYADTLAEPYRRFPPADVERAMNEVRDIASVKHRSLISLRNHLQYPGSHADIDFLIEQHVGYELRVRSLAESELDWMHTARSAVRARTIARGVTRVVIGDNADLYLSSLTKEMHQNLRQMASPLHEVPVTHTPHEQDNEESEYEEDVEAAAAPSGTERAGRQRPKESAANQRKPAEAAAREQKSGGSSRSARRMSARGKTVPPGATPRKRAPEKSFDAFVEVRGRNEEANSPIVSRRNLDEISLSSHDDDYEKGAGAKGKGIITHLLSSRLFVFFAISALMFLYYRVN